MAKSIYPFFNQTCRRFIQHSRPGKNIYIQLTYAYLHNYVHHEIASIKLDARVITNPSTNRRAGQAKHAALLILPAIRGG
jgi:hypothetical protein